MDRYLCMAKSRPESAIWISSLAHQVIMVASSSRMGFTPHVVTIPTGEQYIHTLEASLQEEMSLHAPLYGAGLESLSMKELETLSRIHEEGLRNIHAVQQRKSGNNSLPQVHSLYSTAPPMSVALPPLVIPNGVGIHSNGHMNGAVGPWFNPT